MRYIIDQTSLHAHMSQAIQCSEKTQQDKEKKNTGFTCPLTSNPFYRYFPTDTRISYCYNISIYTPESVLFRCFQTACKRRNTCKRHPRSTPTLWLPACANARKHFLFFPHYYSVMAISRKTKPLRALRFADLFVT